ncbi:NAD(P)-binding domain-containing protein [Actinoplanes sp. NPDC051411]|uniref:NADPH-dependent F420 reductase n=1 Tax=Actinoplanes sp. NPDC051411 TaxID=3155522 RepID=UPI00341F3235
MNIAVVGAGSIGGTLVRQLSAAGHRVSVANRRGPEHLVDLAAATGARAATLAEVAADARVVIVAVPLPAIAGLLGAGLALPADAVVVDTSNYVPHLRDARIGELDHGAVESRWTERQLGHPVVKAFNTITAASLRDKPAPAGTRGRVALPIAGDEPIAKTVVIALAEQIGFAGVDAGPLDESWRQQPGTPVYTTDLGENAIAAALAGAEPAQTEAWRARLTARAGQAPGWS